MHQRWKVFGVLGVVAGCTSSAAPVVPDHSNDNLDVVVRSASQPCGMAVDLDGNGSIDRRYVFSYDAQGRPRRDLGTDPGGTPVEQHDYTWDSAGDLVDQLTTRLMSGSATDEASSYDPQGRRLELRQTDLVGQIPQIRATTSYADFDHFAHPLHADVTVADLVGETSPRMSAWTYGYDQRGRRISLDVVDASGQQMQHYQDVYDEASRSVTTTITVAALHGVPGYTDVVVTTFDVGYHLISTHEVTTNDDGMAGVTSDTQNTWDGDRQLGWSFTSTDPTSTTRQAASFDYSCRP